MWPEKQKSSKNEVYVHQQHDDIQVEEIYKSISSVSKLFLILRYSSALLFSRCANRLKNVVMYIKHLGELALAAIFYLFFQEVPGISQSDHINLSFGTQ